MPTLHRRIRRAFGPTLAFALLPAAGALAADWPGAAPCHASLQACIDAQTAGATVRLVGTTVIDESIVLPRSIVLIGAPGAERRFAPGRGIQGHASAGDYALRLSNLVMEDARVDLRYTGTGRADLTVERLRITSRSAGTGAGVKVSVGADAAATSRVRVQSNRLHVAAPGLFDAALQVSFEGTQDIEADILWNEIASVGESTGWGLLLDAVLGSTSTVRIAGNHVRGTFQRAGLGVSEGLFSTTPSTVEAYVVNNVVVGSETLRSGGLSATTNHGSITLRAINNTVTLSRGLLLMRWGGSGTPTGTTSGLIQNNLIAYNRFALQNTPSAGGSASNDYNLVHVPPYGIAGAHTPGAHDVVAHPRLRSREAPRLNADSPARDAGNSLALLAAGGVPFVDADGLRRVAGAAVDIGAYESGLRSVLESNRPDPSAFLELQDADIRAGLDARLFATPNWSLSMVMAPRSVGYYDFSGAWVLYPLAGGAMPGGAAYNVLAARGTGNVTTHVLGGGNTLDGSSQIDWSVINGQPDAVVLFNRSGSVGNPHPVALQYGGTRWNLVTLDGANMPIASQTYVLYGQTPSPNAWRQTVTTAGTDIVLDHPLLNGTPCARVHASPVAGGAAPVPDYDVWYGGGRWRIGSQGVAFQPGQAFNVLLVPQQVEECTTGRLFRDGLEAVAF